MAALADGVIERWFTEPFRREPSIAVDRVRQMILDTPAHGYAGCCAAIRDMDLRELIGGIRVPTLVIVGEKDPATPPKMAEEIKPHPRCQARGGAGCRTSAQHRAGRGVRCCPHVAARPASRLSRGGRPMSKRLSIRASPFEGGPRRRARRAFARQRRRLQPALSGADHRVLLGRSGAVRGCRARPAACSISPCSPRSIAKRSSSCTCARRSATASPGKKSGGPAPERDLLRRTRRQLGLQAAREVFAQMARKEAVANNLQRAVETCYCLDV